MFQRIVVWCVFFGFGVFFFHISLYFFLVEVLVNIHGHIYNKQVFGAQYRNVSVEMINYTPIALEEIRDANQ